ncbi:MAG: valine--tRNA ligase [Actinomycetota bacterium]|nr:valine--tRNA ligase [Actinomycetota bacterium]
MNAASPPAPSPSSLSTSYQPSEVEQPLYDWWDDSGFFHAEPDDSADAAHPPFCIMLPLPNVTGSLHMGHALDHSVQDAIIRRARMRGDNALWQPGTDHAGIATQNVVERELAKGDLTRHDLGREAFVERVWAWREESGEIILRQMRRLGASCDWQRSVFTLDQHYQDAVRKVFVRLYEQGLIYRGYRLINWCPRDTSAISDIEVDHSDEVGELAFVRYPAADGGDGVVVATTRAETMLGDTAVAVHPDDQRYTDLVGQTLVLPLLGRPIPVVADSHVDPEFGTGAVKVTPAHDPNDYEIGQRHDLDAIDILTDDAHINANGGPYEGLDRFEARRNVKADLEAAGLLVRVEERTHPVGHCSRCGTVVEPRLSEQWFVRVAPLAERAAQAVRDGRVAFLPERNAKGFLNWLDNLHDWCISRQLWWGHRIPAWYDREDRIHVLATDPSPAQVEADGLRQDPDVLDTWFSAQLWPFVTLGWPQDTPELRTWYPTSVLVTGYDINTFWVSRMLMIGLHILDEVPFHAVLNHGLVRDRHGKKMSKSFGNAIDPLGLIDRYGADALRFSLLRGATPGQDAPLAEEWVEGARRFANKLWNAARFVLSRLPDGRGVPADFDDVALQVEDRWLLSRLEMARAAAEEGYASYDLARAARALYHCVWDEYCDWYLELAKPRENDPAAAMVLSHGLDTLLRLLHPLMPFVTEQIWQALWQPAGDSLMCAAWPEAQPGHLDSDAEAAFSAVTDVVTELRKFRADHGLAPSARIDVVAAVSDLQREQIAKGLDGIRKLAGVASWIFAAAANQADAGPVGKVVVAGGELYVPLADLVDLDEERERLRRELARAVAESQRAQRKLSNSGFVAKAPEAVVEAERNKVAEWEAAVAKMTAQLAALG